MDLSEPWKVLIYIKNYGNLFSSKSRNINMHEYPICYEICSSFERVANAFTVSQENFYKGYIFESPCYTTNLQTKEQLNRRHFSINDFERYASKLYSLKYCDLFDEHNVFLTGENVQLQLGLNLTPLQMFTIRNVCSTAKVRHSKKEDDKQK
jgi:hypothetical protein